MFRRVVDDFKNRARERRYVVKDFEWDSDRIAGAERKTHELKTELQQKYNLIVKWCQTMFGEAFSAWMHVKSVRVFIESVLRYGLPPNFVAVLADGDGSPKKVAAARGVFLRRFAH